MTRSTDPTAGAPAEGQGAASSVALPVWRQLRNLEESRDYWRDASKYWAEAHALTLERAERAESRLALYRLACLIQALVIATLAWRWW